MQPPSVIDVRFEHYRPNQAVYGVHDITPRISWRFRDVNPKFVQTEYELEISRTSAPNPSRFRVASDESYLRPWPQPENPLQSRETCSVRVRVWAKGLAEPLSWSQPASIEIGLVQRDDWKSSVISAPWSSTGTDEKEPQPEDLFRKRFTLPQKPVFARLYITSLGVYEAEINGKRVGDYFMAPGWTSYHGHLQYQTYDVTDLLRAEAGDNCLAVRVAEGWFKGRLGFFGGRRNIFGTQTGLMAQLEISFEGGDMYTLITDDTWTVTRGPIRRAEIYDGEIYDARCEILGWSSPDLVPTEEWTAATVLPPLQAQLVSGSKPATRRLEIFQPVQVIKSPSGKTILDFGQNLVGVLRIKNVTASPGHRMALQHTEVLEDGELGLRPLRLCKARDEYYFRGNTQGESYEPRFTFHGFRYAQIDGWPAAPEQLMESVEAVVCYTDMEEAGTFSCSDERLTKLFINTKWSMKGNFLSIPTDCPQRDERLGWTGDLALFTPTATLIYNCFGILKDWLSDLAYEQGQRGGIPPLFCPDVEAEDPWPCSLWHDVSILAPWALWQESRDITILKQQYESMRAWLSIIPRATSRLTGLWDPTGFHFADWLDPNAPPENPHKAMTDPILVANAFLIRSLTLMVQIATLLGNTQDANLYDKQLAKAKREFQEEYVTKSGRLVSDSQTAYSLALCFDILSPQQSVIAGDRLAEIVKANNFCIGTGFAGTPFVCDALVVTGHSETAYKMILNEKCPSWLYPISMGSTTIWERWDSMRPDGSINPGEMTSFNHYALGAVSGFLVQQVAGLRRVDAGWRHSRFSPVLGGGIMSANATHETPYGTVSASWSLQHSEKEKNMFEL
ncbi:hypothetical protein BDV12DRAFT_181617, partial [Aspergillus spectabilis]